MKDRVERRARFPAVVESLHLRNIASETFSVTSDQIAMTLL